jgi:hypothetical protein
MSPADDLMLKQVRLINPTGWQVDNSDSYLVQDKSVLEKCPHQKMAPSFFCLFIFAYSTRISTAQLCSAQICIYLPSQGSNLTSHKFIKSLLILGKVVSLRLPQFFLV